MIWPQQRSESRVMRFSAVSSVCGCLLCAWVYLFILSATNLWFGASVSAWTRMKNWTIYIYIYMHTVHTHMLTEKRVNSIFILSSTNLWFGASVSAWTRMKNWTEQKRSFVIVIIIKYCAFAQSLYIYIYICMCVFVCVYICMCVFVCVCVYIYIYIYIYLNTVHTHAHRETC